MKKLMTMGILGFVTALDIFAQPAPVIPATQTEVNSGTIHNKFVAPDTLKNFVNTNGGSTITSNDTAMSGQTRVDKLGSDTTGKWNNFAFPFLNISNAISATPSGGGTLNIGVGKWNEANLTRFGGLNVNLLVGSVVNYSNIFTIVGGAFDGLPVQTPIFSDFDYVASAYQNFNGYWIAPFATGTGSTNGVSGNGDFIITDEDTFTGAAFCILYNSNTVFSLDGNSLMLTNQAADTGQGVIGILPLAARYAHFKFNFIDWTVNTPADGNVRAPIDYGSGQCVFDVGTITARVNSDCFDVSDLGVGGGDSSTSQSDASVMIFNGSYLNATNSTGNCVWGYGAANTLQQLFWNCSTYESGTGSAISDVGGNGKWYVSGLGAGKMSNHSTTHSVIEYLGDSGTGTAANTAGTTNNIWLTGFAKITDNNGGGFYYYTGSRTNTGNMYLQSQEWEDKATPYHTEWNINTGTHTIAGGGKTTKPTNARGFGITNAVVTAVGLNIDTSTANLGSSNECFYLQGTSNMLTLVGGSYTSGANTPVIRSPTAQTVFCKNVPQINGSLSNNITMIGAWMSNGVLIASGAFAGDGSALTNISGTSLNYNSVAHTPVAVTLTGSAFLYTNTTPSTLECYFSGSVAYAVSKHNTAVFGSLAGDGYFLLQPTNYLSITYTVAPTFYTNAW